MSGSTKLALLFLVGAAVVTGACGGGSAGLFSGLVTGANNNDMILNDNADATGEYPSAIVISTPKTSIRKITVMVNLTHTFPDDVDMLLVGPSGLRIMLMSDCFGGTDMFDRLLTFADDATMPVPTGDSTASENFMATDDDSGGDADLLPGSGGGFLAMSLTGFIGQNPNGTWRLYAKDDNGTDSGVINGWSLWLSVE